jgi:threonine-phosphate decarboxylase
MSDHPFPDHGGQLRALAARFHLQEESLLDFSASISPIPPSDALVDALCESLRKPKLFTCYPDAEYVKLKQAIAQYIGIEQDADVDADAAIAPNADVGPDAICIGNGAMSLLAAAARALDMRRCLVLTPAFGEYRKSLAIGGVSCVTLALSATDGFAIDCGRVLAELKSTGADALLIANPQSPSGRIMPASQLSQLQQEAAHLGVTTIVDEAFIDYAPEESLSRAASKSARLVVIRSITKFFAMPGLRVSYAVAPPDICCRMAAAMPLWPVDSIAAEAACLALYNADSISATRTMNAVERAWLTHQLREIGMTVFPAAANYLLFNVDDTLDGLELWRRLLLDYGIVIRSCANFEGLDRQYFRVAVRSRSENRQLVAALADLMPRCEPPGPRALNG